VIVVTHGAVGELMIRAAESKVGPLDGLRAVGVEPDAGADIVQRRIDEAVRALHTDEVVFLVDLAGSTPANLCCRPWASHSVVVTGVNLAMLFKLATADRTHGARPLAEDLARTGAKSIAVRDDAPETR
jgi:mannose/fructose-specific phosphotransferase system component IIA